MLYAIILVVIALFVQRYVLNHGIDGVGYSRTVSEPTVEPRQPFDVITCIDNPGWRPIAFIKLRESVPDTMELLSDGLNVIADSRGHKSLVSSIYLMPRQKLTRRFSACLPRRGRYFLRGSQLSGGDFLGLHENTAQYDIFSEIIVVPAPANYDGVLDTLGGFLGDISVSRFIMEDPVLTLGYREYTMREPQKMISWTQSASKNRLMVKKYDYTLELTVTVLLNIDCAARGEEGDRLIELCYSLARTVCATLEERGIQYDFITNAMAAGAFSLWSAIGEGLGTKHFMTILEGLGRATYVSSEPFDRTLMRAAQRAQQGRSYIIITPGGADGFAYWQARLQDITGGRICVIDAAEVSI